MTDAAREGLHGFAAGPGNVLFAVWLDLRRDASSEGGTKLYGTISRDGGQSWEKNVRVYASPDGTICQCCHPSVTIDAKGVLHVMWRNASERFARSLLHFLGRWWKDICVSPETGPMVRGLSMPAQWMAEK